MNSHGPITKLQALAIHGYSYFYITTLSPLFQTTWIFLKADPGYHTISPVNLSLINRNYSFSAILKIFVLN